MRRGDSVCVGILLVMTLAVYGPGLFGGKVFLPADIVPLMRPWAVTARERFPDFRMAQNQMHGPIFEYYSWRHYARERIRAGEVPLWNPYELGGNVLLANSQSAVLYPPNLLLYVLPLWVGINLVTALHTFLTGLFLYLLLRTLRRSPPAALTAALVWMFCGLQIVWTEFQTPTAVLCWLPAVLLGWELFVQGGGWRWSVLGSGSAIALALLAGHLQFAFYVILAFVVYAVIRRTTNDQRPLAGRWLFVVGRSSLVVLACTLLLGISLSLATMLPVMEMGRMNFRAGKTEYAQSIGLRLPPKNLFTLLQPNLFGNPRDYFEIDANGTPQNGHAYFGAFDFIEYCAYLGIPALILAGIGIGRSGVQAFRRLGAHGSASYSAKSPPLAFMVLTLLGLLLALGTPLCALLFYGVPGYRQFNATARALCLFSFGIAALTAYGVDALREADIEAWRRTISRIATGTVLIVLVLGLAAFPGMALFEKTTTDAGKSVARLLTDQWFGYELAGLGHFAVFLGLTAIWIWLILRNPQSAIRNPQFTLWLLPAIAAADLLTWGFTFNPRTDPAMLDGRTETTTILQSKSPDRVVSLENPPLGIKSFIVPNYNAVVRTREVQGADSLHTKRYHETLAAVVKAMEPGRTAAFTDPNTLHVPAVNHPFFDLMNVRYVTTDPAVILGSPYRKVADAELSIWENPKAFGPAWVVGGNLTRVESAEQAVRSLGDPAFDARSSALIESAPQFRFTRGNGAARCVEFSPHQLIYDVDSTGDCLLVASEIFYPGWQVTVDGRPSRLVRADWILRATPIAAGHHTVSFKYAPASYRVGLYLSALAAGLCAMIMVSSRAQIRPT